MTRSKHAILINLLAAMAITLCSLCQAFPVISTSQQRCFSTVSTWSSTSLNAIEPPPGGISASLDDGDDNDSGLVGDGQVVSVAQPSSPTSTSPTSGTTATERMGINSRGAKMNEIDFTLAPSDVSLSRCYQMSSSGGIANGANEVNGGNGVNNGVVASSQSLQEQQKQRVQTLSLTRALNTASNRAVRRILLARSWPSAEALNLSLRTVLMQQQKQQQQPQKVEDSQKEVNESEEDKMKCPVPRPILNILTKNRRGESEVSSNGVTQASVDPTPRATGKDKEQEWIANQIAVFRDSYSSVPGYDLAEAYLDCILSLATSGVESPRVEEVIKGGAYVEPYKRILSVIQSVGAVLEEVPGSPSRKRIAPKLVDQDICLSMLDKIALINERNQKDSEKLSAGGNGPVVPENPLAVPYDAAAKLAYDSDENNKSMSFDDFKEKYESDVIAMVTAKKRSREEENQNETEKAEKVSDSKVDKESEPKGAYEKGRKRRLVFWAKEKGSDESEINDGLPMAETTDVATAENPVIKPDDLGGVLLSAEEPTMTRQLNVLSNIVQRTLIFGGDQELLVLAETLDADKPAFIKRWYKSDSNDSVDVASETRPGVQYLNALIRLLRDCYTKGVLYDVTPTLPLTSGYRNAYERLTASLIELGSGYVRPTPSSSALALSMTSAAATAKYLTSTAPPKTAREELGRFAKWESAVRKNRENPYPDDLVGVWNVEDIVGGSTIGSTKVTFRPQGQVQVMPPMQGLRWRLDPGPTHLDTCTFQVLSDDGAILQYRGFVDRGSRLEARVSKRPVTMRGSVSFLMRDAEMGGIGNMGDDYWDDMLPINYKSGLTKFVMTRTATGDNDDMSRNVAASTNETVGR